MSRASFSSLPQSRKSHPLRRSPTLCAACCSGAPCRSILPPGSVKSQLPSTTAAQVSPVRCPPPPQSKPVLLFTEHPNPLLIESNECSVHSKSKDGCLGERLQKYSPLQGRARVQGQDKESIVCLNCPPCARSLLSLA